MITLIVKGDEAAAKAAANAHGVELTSITPHPKFPECICTAKDEQINEVVNWFVEPSSEAPFPPGTLMWYSAR